MVTSTIQSGRKASSVRNLFSRMFGISLNMNGKNDEYTIAILDGSPFGECVNTLKVLSNESPAVLALRMFRSNPQWDGCRLWISDPMLNNRFPHRFRCWKDMNGECRLTMIEPRRR
jgi:hypothetical protein